MDRGYPAEIFTALRIGGDMRRWSEIHAVLILLLISNFSYSDVSYRKKRWQLRKRVSTPLKRQIPFHNRCGSVFASLKSFCEHPSTTKN
jgi:hypothetical protein